MSDTAATVKRKISFHPEIPDFVNAWKHTSKWKSFDSPPIKTLAKWATKRCWSGIDWIGGYRETNNFLRADWGALDFDGSYSLEQACKDWCDTTSIIMTTKSDSPKERRFRVLFLYEKTITSCAQYVYNIETFIDKYNSDSNAIDGGRMFWPGREIVQIVEDGYLQPVLPVPPNYKSYNEKELICRKKYKRLGELDIFPHEIISWFKGNDVEGKRNKLCHRISKYLFWWGMKENKIMELILASDVPRKNYSSQREALHAAERGIRRAKDIDKEEEEKKCHKHGDFVPGDVSSNQPGELQQQTTI